MFETEAEKSLRAIGRLARNKKPETLEEAQQILALIGQVCREALTVGVEGEGSASA